MKNLVFFILLVFSICLIAQTEISGDLTGTLDLSDSPFQVVGDIVVNSGETLTITPGCVLEFMGNYSIEIETGASFISEGTETQPIIYTCSASLPLDDISRYDGIIAGLPETFVFTHCIVENAFSETNSIIFISTLDSMRISDCEFRNNMSYVSYPSPDNGTILFYSGPHLMMENCTFTDNQANHTGGLFCLGNLHISSSVFENNTSDISGGAVFVRDYERCHIEDSRFDRNSSQLGGAIASEISGLSTGKIFLFERNICSFNEADNYGGVIYLGRSGKLLMNNDVFVGNSAIFGGAFADVSPSSESFDFVAKHCTFYENEASVGNISSSVNYGNDLFMNCIIYDTFDSGYLMYNSGGSRNAARFDHCLVDLERLSLLGIRYVTDCFFEDPLFVDGDLPHITYNLNLRAESPCIDNGCYMYYIHRDTTHYACSDDIEHEPRPSLYGYDIGAYEYPGEFVNLPPVIDCPGDIVSFNCPVDSMSIAVHDLFPDSLFQEDTTEYLYPALLTTPDEFLVFFECWGHDSLLDGRPLMFSVSDGEFADTCYFSFSCVPSSIDPGDCEEDTVYIYVGARNDTVEYRTNGITPEASANAYLNYLDDDFFVDEYFVSAGVHYEYTLLLTANEDLIGEHICNVSFYDSTRFRCVDVRVIVEERPNTPPYFFGCPDTLIILVPSEITFVYLQIEDDDLDSLDIELIEYPEPYEGFWNFREDLIEDTYHVYMQFYPSYEDTGMHIFRVRASDGEEHSDCIIYAYVTKDTTELCPYVEPDTIYIDYLEGNPEYGEVAIYDHFNIHNWHIETDCDSLLCIYPQYGFGTDSSTVIPECKMNKLELVFALDVTGSMGSEIFRMITGISEIVNMMDSAMIDVRYGLCPFRDDTWAVDMDGLMEGINLTANSELFLDSLESLVAMGGGDGPEVGLDAIATAVNNYDWTEESYKQIILLTDIMYHFRGDGTDFSDYVPSEIDILLTTHGTSLSVIYSGSWYPRPEWYVDCPELTGGFYYDSEVEYGVVYSDILDRLSEYSSLSGHLSSGLYECNLTYVLDYPITCSNIDVPVILNVLDSTETIVSYNCPSDTCEIVAGETDTIQVLIDYIFSDSTYAELYDYPIDHADMWSYNYREGFNRNTVTLIFDTEETDTGIYHFSFLYGNEYMSDTCTFIVQILGQEPFYHFYEGWNLLSYPFTEPNSELITLNPDMVRPYIWNASDYTYELPDEITTADAFWLYSNIEMYYDIHYTTISEITTTLYAGWNMVSSVGDTLEIDVLTTHPEVVTPVYYYDANAGEYESATEILPGIGYWLMSTETFEISYP